MESNRGSSNSKSLRISERRIEAEVPKTPGSSSYSSKLSIKCNHEVAAPLKEVKSGPNKGQKFYGCPFWRNDNCNFFVWAAEAEKMELEIIAEEIELSKVKVDDLMEEKKLLEERLVKEAASWEAHVTKLKIKTERLKGEAIRASNTEKKAVMAAILSWFCMTIVLALYLGSK